MNVTGFLNKYCKPIMTEYYKKKYRKDIYNCLTLHMNYGTLPFDQVVQIMACDYNGDLQKAAKIWGICVYCGFLQRAK